MVAYIIVCFGISAFAAALYWNSLDGEFVFDDISVAAALMPEILRSEKRDR